ncbi:hypothetical protein [Streptomyces sp. TR02-1]|uniref:hypothetical protein n=1 Tax=Streptomyces sp. TR02-1 TaxID=3385977 RepID=UPI0039A268EA
MTYRADVEFLELCNPALIEQNADEFRRLHQLLDSTDDSFRKAKLTDWVSEANDRYERELRDAEYLARDLSVAYRDAWKALNDYADAVEKAKGRFSDGTACESKLSEVMSRVATPVTETAQQAEPMRQWEDLRKRTGVLDWIAEIAVDVDEIRDEAENYYNQIEQAYADAARLEREAREDCTADLRKAYRSLPDLRGDLPHPSTLLAGMPGFENEVREAADDPYVTLPGTGPKVDGIPRDVGDGRVSPKLQEIRSRLEGMPEAKGNNYWLPSNSDEDRREWIHANREQIRDAAQHTGLPADMVAGIAWQEVQGDPGWADDIAHNYRQNQHEAWPEVQWVADKVGLSGAADETSMGPMAIQLRRSAEVLGYDPQHMTPAQWSEVEEATQNPGTNIYIASEYLAQLKAESEFADVPADELTPAQRQELAARYNGGPYWESDAAQAYGRGFANNADDARQALRD